MSKLREESHIVYASKAQNVKQEEDAIIASALCILEKRMKVDEIGFGGSDSVVAYHRLHLGSIPEEKFIVLALDIKNRVIKTACEFKGKENSCTIYVKQIVKSLIQTDRCVSAILIHNHPSGDPKPSSEDFTITKKIKDACSLVDLIVLDHIIVTSQGHYSFADERSI